MNLTNLPTPPVVAVQSVLSSQGHGKGYSKQGQAQRCTHCGRNNHTVDTCFAKHSLPPGWKSKKAVNQVSVYACSCEEL
jgi:hypothetical protein